MRTAVQGLIAPQASVTTNHRKVTPNSSEKLRQIILKATVLAQALTNGYCAIPIVAGPCPHPNACLNCAHFRTDATFLEVHRAELQETERVIAKADANGWVRQSEMNERKRTSLINIVATLEASHG
jgi:hypothetical protein